MTEKTPQEKLHSAIGTGNLDLAKEAIAQGADPRFSDDLPLRLVAAKAGNVELARFLLSLGADAGANNNEPLQRAVMQNDTALAQLLLESGADPNAPGRSFLLDAVNGHRHLMLQLLLRNGADPHLADNAALCAAVKHAHYFMVEELVAYGADPFIPESAAQPRGQEASIEIYLCMTVGDKTDEFLSALQAVPAGQVGAFLRAPYADTREPALVRAVRMGCVAQALDALRRGGETLYADDLQRLATREGVGLADLATQKKELAAFFARDLWGTSVQEMWRAYSGLSDAQKKASGVDIGSIQNEVYRRRRAALLRRPRPDF